MAVTCKRCGVKQGLMSAIATDMNAVGLWHCPACAAHIAAEEERRESERVARVRSDATKVIVTTTPAVDGFRIDRYLGIESVEFVIGTGVFSEVSTSIADFFGARSSAFEQKLQRAKKHALGALKYIAAEKGANAVVGIDLDFAEFSGNRIALIINGTLVKLDPPPFPDVPVAAAPVEPKVAAAPKPAARPRAQEWMPEFPEDPK